MKKADLVELYHIQQRHGKDELVLYCSVFSERKKNDIEVVQK